MHQINLLSLPIYNLFVFSFFLSFFLSCSRSLNWWLISDLKYFSYDSNPSYHNLCNQMQTIDEDQDDDQHNNHSHTTLLYINKIVFNPNALIGNQRPSVYVTTTTTRCNQLLLLSFDYTMICLLYDSIYKSKKYIIRGSQKLNCLYSNLLLIDRCVIITTTIYSGLIRFDSSFPFAVVVDAAQSFDLVEYLLHPRHSGPIKNNTKKK